MKTTHSIAVSRGELSAGDLLQELTACEMAAVDGGNIIVRAAEALVGGVVRFITALAFADPYCILPMTFDRPCT
jgi:hypothetical protein